MEDYMVSIRLMSYNHEAYIKQALEGIQIQQTTFKIEVIIGDDFSTDKTLDIIRSVIQDTDHIFFKVIERKDGDDYSVNRSKLGRLYNFTDIISHCQGKYLALLDGDDYWIDPLKLQKQVDFLEQHKEYSLVFHNAFIERNGVLEDKFNTFSESREISIKKLINKNIIATASCMYRKEDVTIPDWFYNVRTADWALHLLVAQHGKIFYLNEVMGVYRIHSEGVWNKMSHNERIMQGIETLEILSNTAGEYKYLYQKAIASRKAKLHQPKSSGFINWKERIFYYWTIIKRAIKSH